MSTAMPDHVDVNEYLKVLHREMPCFVVSVKHIPSNVSSIHYSNMEFDVFEKLFLDIKYRMSTKLKLV